MKRLTAAAVALVMALSLTGCGSSSNRVTFKDVNVEQEDLRLKVAGDNILTASIFKYAKTDDGTYKFDNMYSRISNYISDADISVINLESPIAEDVPSSSAYAPPVTMCDALIGAGFDVICQANNHVTDKGTDGIKSTIENWRLYPQVTYLGIHDSEEDAKKIRFVEAKGIKLALVNYTYGVNRSGWPEEGQEFMVDIYDEEKISDAVARAKRLSDMVIMFLHDGNEYSTKPTDSQKEHINHCIDSGADIVICSHSHVLQPYESVTTPRGNTGLVYYSLGNFISGADKPSTLLGGVAEISLKKEITSDKKTRITVTGYGLEPVVTHTVSADKTCKVFKLRDYSNGFASESDYGKKHKDYTVNSLWDLYNTEVNGVAPPTPTPKPEKTKKPSKASPSPTATATPTKESTMATAVPSGTPSSSSSNNEGEENKPDA